MKLLSVLITLALLMAMPVRADDKPARVQSMNVCADQYLIALADKDQVVALSNFARDPHLSFYAHEAAAYPVSTGSVEETLALQPDLIVVSATRRQLAVAQLRKRNFRMIEIKPAESYQAIVEQTRLVATALGHPERGEALIAQMDAELAALPAPDPRGEAAYYQRRGMLTGTGTLVDDIMRRAGLTNVATRLQRKAVSRMPLELIIQTAPDYLILETDADRLPDNGIALLAHPALAQAIPAGRRLFLRQAATVCGGPFFPQTVKTLAAQLR